MAGAAARPLWEGLYEVAAAQEGLFSSAQAAEAGCSPQLLRRYLMSGRIRRVRRGTYRVVHFPPGEHEDLVAIWLWSNREGVFSHETALALHELSDVLPAKAYLTVPSEWRARRMKIPRGVILQCADLEATDRTWLGAIPVTTVVRTLDDALDARVALEQMARAIRSARLRGLITKGDAMRLQGKLRKAAWK
jgi:predicted transcriptional regulator of viral defense system